jgi:Tol biopolymer transport system component
MLILSACGSGPESAASFPASASIPTDEVAPTGWILLERVGVNDARSLWLIRPDGSELHELAPGVPVDGKTNPVWSRDGTYIAFESVHPRRLSYEMDVAGSTPVPVWDDCSGVLAEPDPCIEGSPAYSPDGNDLATVVNYLSGLAPIKGIEVIYLRHRLSESGGCSQEDRCFHLGYSFDSTQVSTSTASIEGLSWSPDGSQIAYYRVAKDVVGKPLRSELWIVDADGTDPHPIALPEGLNAGDPDWSPDGSLIVFSSEPIHDWTEVRVESAPDVYTVRPDGTDLRQLTRDGASGAPSWTSDGRILFFSQGALRLMDEDGSNAAPVYPDLPALWGGATGWSYYGYWQPVP